MVLKVLLLLLVLVLVFSMLKFFLDEASSKLEDLLNYVRGADEFEAFCGDRAIYKLQDALDELILLKKYLEFD